VASVDARVNASLELLLRALLGPRLDSLGG
jgi:hypothetical protein